MIAMPVGWDNVQTLKIPDTIECGHCELGRPYSARHCGYCKYCVDELDHHCPWCGKCIGEVCRERIFLIRFCNRRLTLFFIILLYFSIEQHRMLQLFPYHSLLSVILPRRSSHLLYYIRCRSKDAIRSVLLVSSNCQLLKCIFNFCNMA
jgi:hypothetical protein